MKLKALPLILLGCCVALSSCEKRTAKPQPKPSVEPPIAYRELAEWQVPPAPNVQGNGLQGIAVDNQGNVYVADAEGPRIVVYSPDGKLLRAIERDARHPKILQRPFGLLFVGPDRLYVTDYDADQIQVFTTEGKFLFAWGREEKAGDNSGPRWGSTRIGRVTSTWSSSTACASRNLPMKGSSS